MKNGFAVVLLIAAATVMGISCHGGSRLDRSLFTVEVVDGARLVHNHDPQLGSEPGARLELVGRIGKPESDDERELLYDPIDAAVLPNGDVLVLEGRGSRVKRFSGDHRWISSFGQPGAGPGDMTAPYALEWSARDKALYVAHDRVSRFSPDGIYENGFKPAVFKPVSNSLAQQYRSAGMAVLSGSRIVLPNDIASWDAAKEPGLLAVLDETGQVVRAFGAVKRFDEPLLTINANIPLFTADAEDNVYVAYAHQNRIDKYAPDGRLVFSADRRLPYEPKFEVKMQVFRSGSGAVEFPWPAVTSVSKGIGLDSKSRIWVLTFLREPDEFGRFEDQADMADCYVFDVFDADGIHLFQVSCPNVRLDGLSMAGDRLFFIDSGTESCVHEYRIVDSAGH